MEEDPEAPLGRRRCVHGCAFASLPDGAREIGIGSPYNASQRLGDNPARGVRRRITTKGRPRTRMKRLSVLITSSYYWPEGAGTAPYLTGLAEYLSDRGHTVVVATTFAHYPEWRSSANGRFRETEVLRGVVVRRRSHFVPRRQSAGQRALYEATLFGGGLTAIHLRHRPDVVVGTCPSLAAGALARAAAAVYRVPYGLIFQDLMGLAARQSGVAGGDRVASAVRGAELRFARRAERIAIIAEGFRRYFEDGGVEPGRIDRLRNWTRRTEPEETTAETRRRLGWGPDEFVCLHGGNMGQKQGLGNLLAAAELLPTHGSGRRSPGTETTGPGSRRMRPRRGASATLDFIAMQAPRPLGRDDAGGRRAACESARLRADMSLPSKLTSYFASGRPLLAAVSADSETAREIEWQERGSLCRRPSRRPFATIVALRNDPRRRRRAWRAGRALRGDEPFAHRRSLEYTTPSSWLCSPERPGVAGYHVSRRSRRRRRLSSGRRSPRDISWRMRRTSYSSRQSG